MVKVLNYCVHTIECPVTVLCKIEKKKTPYYIEYNKKNIFIFTCPSRSSMTADAPNPVRRDFLALFFFFLYGGGSGVHWDSKDMGLCQFVWLQNTSTELTISLQVGMIMTFSIANYDICCIL